MDPVTAVARLESDIEEHLSEFLSAGTTAKNPGKSVMVMLCHHYKQQTPGYSARAATAKKRAIKRAQTKAEKKAKLVHLSERSPHGLVTGWFST